MAITFDTLIPNLVVADVARSLIFYRDVLGFEVVTTVPAEAPHVFVWLRRGDVHVYLNDAQAVLRESHGGAGLAAGQSGISMFLKVTGLRALHDAIAPRVTIVAPLERKFYGLTEFALTDPDGYLITFAEQID